MISFNFILTNLGNKFCYPQKSSRILNNLTYVLVVNMGENHSWNLEQPNPILKCIFSNGMYLRWFPNFLPRTLFLIGWPKPSSLDSLLWVGKDIGSSGSVFKGMQIRVPLITLSVKYIRSAFKL